MQIEITSKVAEAVTQVTIVTLNSQQLIKNTLIKLVALSTLKSKLGATNIISSKLSKRSSSIFPSLHFPSGTNWDREKEGEESSCLNKKLGPYMWASVYFAGAVTLYQM